MDCTNQGNANPTVNTYIWRIFLFDAIGDKKQKLPNTRPRNTVLNSVTQEAINGHTPLVCWYLYRQKTTFERWSMLFQHSGRSIILKGATKGKSMLPTGTIFFPLKISPPRTENNFEGHYIEKLSKSSFFNMSVF